ncbi:hypothetical protein ACIBP6_01325 [Nonomuraea terrae]|uniref:hypothetical protein n=1 Tax=Nonomuraea terrae TaxID=2530383 RepID=UPI0037B1DEC8
MPGLTAVWTTTAAISSAYAPPEADLMTCSSAWSTARVQDLRDGAGTVGRGGQ